ncbi:hypothetical protein ACLOJK_038890 [Asimina triloba]
MCQSSSTSYPCNPPRGSSDWLIGAVQENGQADMVTDLVRPQPNFSGGILFSGDLFIFFGSSNGTGSGLAHPDNNSMMGSVPSSPFPARSSSAGRTLDECQHTEQ